VILFGGAWDKPGARFARERNRAKKIKKRYFDLDIEKPPFDEICILAGKGRDHLSSEFLKRHDSIKPGQTTSCHSI
jgi:hypothetical protein